MVSEKVFLKAMKEARELVKASRVSQMTVAKIALGVCEITWGGASHDEMFTIKRFAFGVGINSKTLSSWIAIRRGVYEKLPADLQNTMTYTQLHAVCNKVTKDASREKVESLARKHLKTPKMDKIILGYLRETKTIMHNLDNGAGVFKLKDETLEEILFWMSMIVRYINKERPKIKPKNNDLISTSDRTKVFSAAEFAGPDRKVSITVKDQKIINHLKRQSPTKWHSPTKLGLKLSRHNKSSSSAWAGRTLNKLLEAGFMEKNEDGKYRLTRAAGKL